MKYNEEKMKPIIFLITILALAACTGQPVNNTDPIAGYWSGNVDKTGDDGQELPPVVIGILIVAGCTPGEVCGKYSEDGHCPGDISLMKIDGNRFSFRSENAGGSRSACGTGDTLMLDLELNLDGTILLVFQNESAISCIMERQ
jgi:hypothetical protein